MDEPSKSVQFLPAPGIAHGKSGLPCVKGGNSNRASDAASELINNDAVDLVLAASTPDTTIPVADQCELNGVPCVTTDTPWQPYFFGRKGDPAKGFDWTYHYFWGLEDIIGVYTSMWSQIPSAKTVGSLWPNDPDGNAWSDPKRGFPPVLAAKNFSLSDLGRFPLPADNFSPFISAFKKNDVDIVTGVIPPPDFAKFWNQAGQQSLQPKIVTVAKATEFHAAIEAFGDRADGLSVEVWWSPVYPFSSSRARKPGAPARARRCCVPIQGPNIRFRGAAARACRSRPLANIGHARR
jgi:branched-chain amino acid transport system substrate-binding protein